MNCAFVGESTFPGLRWVAVIHHEIALVLIDLLFNAVIALTWKMQETGHAIHYIDIVDMASHQLLKRETLPTAAEAHLRRVQIEAMLLQVHPAAFGVRVYEVHRVSTMEAD